jgi:hypothetical protein
MRPAHSGVLPVARQPANIDMEPRQAALFRLFDAHVPPGQDSLKTLQALLEMVHGYPPSAAESSAWVQPVGRHPKRP